MNAQINGPFQDYMADKVSESFAGMPIFRWELSNAIETRSMAEAFAAGIRKGQEALDQVQKEKDQLETAHAQVCGVYLGLAASLRPSELPEDALDLSIGVVDHILTPSVLMKATSESLCFAPLRKYLAKRKETAPA